MNNNPLPNGWVETLLGNVVPRAQYGVSVPLQDDQGIPVLRMNNLRGGSVDLSELSFSSSSEAARLTLEPNDVLFNRTNSIEHVGRTSLWRGELDLASFASYLVRLVPDRSRLDPQYLVRWLNLADTQLRIRQFATPGVHQVNINPTNLRRTLIRFPERLLEQRQIAEVLCTLDGAIEQTESSFAKYQQIKAGLMRDLFTRGVTPNAHLRPPRAQAPQFYKESALGWIPRDWDAVLLDSLATRGSGHTPNKLRPEFWNGGIKWVSLADSWRLDRLYISDTEKEISQQGIAHSSAVLHPAGIVVLSRDAGVGKSAITTCPMAVSQHFMCWRCGDKIDSHYLYYWLQHRKRDFENIATGSTIPTIGLRFFKHYQIAAPANAREQKHIGAALRALDSTIFGVEAEVEKLRKLRLGLMHDLLIGRVRVKVAESEGTPA